MLLIIVPYKAGSSLVVQRDADWLTFAEDFAEYKTYTGLRAAVLTLDMVNTTYSGVDEAERVKQAIYQYVTADGARYVLLVGDFGVFPVRYQFSGYMDNGAASYSYSADYCGGAPPCLYTEAYANNVRGTDGNTLHPDVAVGRVPAETPAEFQQYIAKVTAYENHVAAATSRQTPSTPTRPPASTALPCLSRARSRRTPCAKPG